MFTANQQKLARLVANAPKGAKVVKLWGSASRPILGDNGIVYIGQHFWWGLLVPQGREFEDAIKDWAAGNGKFFSSQGVPASV